MKKMCTVLMVALLMVAVSSPAWAHGTPQSRFTNHSQNDNHSYFAKLRERIHQMIVQYQFHGLKMQYNRSDPEARQMFIEYLGLSSSSCDEQLQALKEEYEQEIAALNTTVSTQQQQIDTLESQNASCNSSLTEAEEALESKQDELDQLSADLQTALGDLTQCNEALEQAYLDCQATEPDEPANVIDTDPVSPYAIDVNGAGHIFVLDEITSNVSVFNSAGEKTTQWDFSTLVQPADIALDAQGNLYILDKQATDPLQKYSPDGIRSVDFTSIPQGFISPTGLFITSDGTIYITGMGPGNSGMVLSLENQSMQTFGNVTELASEEYRDIVVDEQSGIIYVLTESKVARFDINGGYMYSWEGDFSNANGIALGQNGEIFVADTGNNEIDVYDNTGALQSSIAQDVLSPYRIVTDSTGKLYVTDYGNNRVRIFE